ncbi:MAG TPA: hypothetical protein VJM11_01805 [Nevskiaceae bacterium]|nr:hypothetical protein [Nevskiaceae bacterium]
MPTFLAHPLSGQFAAAPESFSLFGNPELPDLPDLREACALRLLAQADRSVHTTTGGSP